MSLIKELANQQLTPDYYISFLRPNSLEIDYSRISLSVLCGDERNILKTPITGDSTLVLRYREKEGAVLSMETNTEDLTLVQLQGAKSPVSYQITTSISWVRLFGDQVEKIITHPKCCFERISMPPLDQIIGLHDAESDKAVGRYQQLANILKLRFSHEDLKFVRDLRDPSFIVVK